MRAWTTAGEGTVTVSEEPDPTPGPHDVLVQIRAVSLNYRDLLVVNGVDHWKPQGPVVPVSDGVGVVLAVGSRVTRFVVGDRVSPMFLPLWRSGPLTLERAVDPVGGPVTRGMLAELVVVNEEEAAKVPQSLDDVEAATLPVAGVTAWHALKRRCGVRKGERLLVHGTGGVALFALQFATALGAHVAVTSGSDEKLIRSRELGAAHTVNRRTEPDIASSVLDWSGSRGVDHVVETVGGANLNLSLETVKLGGTVAFIGLIAGRSAEINTYDFVRKNVTVHGVETGSREMYEEMASFVDLHQIRPVVHAVRAVDQVRGALTDLEQAQHFGKLVLILT